MATALICTQILKENIHINAKYCLHTSKINHKLLSYNTEMQSSDEALITMLQKFSSAP